MKLIYAALGLLVLCKPVDAANLNCPTFAPTVKFKEGSSEWFSNYSGSLTRVILTTSTAHGKTEIAMTCVRKNGQAFAPDIGNTCKFREGENVQSEGSSPLVSSAMCDLNANTNNSSCIVVCN